MGYIETGLRTREINGNSHQYESQDTQWSRQLRRTQRHLTYDQSVQNTEKTSELRIAKESYTKIRDARPDVSSDEYEEWKIQYSKAQEDYQAQKQDIEDFYDDIMQDLEDEATEEETWIQDMQSVIQDTLQVIESEGETTNERTKTNIKKQTINLNG